MIVLAQILTLIFFLVVLYCEVSHKFRDCKLHVSIRYILMITSLVVAAKLDMFAASPLVVKISLLIVEAASYYMLWKFVLKRQVRIRGFRKLKLQMKEFEKQWRSNG